MDASHRPLSSLSASVRLSGHLRNLWHRTETLILADDNTAEATELLLQLANASCSSGTRISRSSKRLSSVSCRCRAGSSSRCRSSKRGNSISNNRNCGKSEAEEAPGARSWTLPCLRHLRIYSSMGGGYIRHCEPSTLSISLFVICICLSASFAVQLPACHSFLFCSAFRLTQSVCLLVASHLNCGINNLHITTSF